MCAKFVPLCSASGPNCFPHFKNNFVFKIKIDFLLLAVPVNYSNSSRGVVSYVYAL